MLVDFDGSDLVDGVFVSGSTREGFSGAERFLGVVFSIAMDLDGNAEVALESDVLGFGFQFVDGRDPRDWNFPVSGRAAEANVPEILPSLFVALFVLSHFVFDVHCHDVLGASIDHGRRLVLVVAGH